MKLPAVAPPTPRESLTSNIHRTLALIHGAGHRAVDPLNAWRSVTNFATAEQTQGWSALTGHDIERVTAATFRPMAAALPPLGEVLDRGRPAAYAARKTWFWPGTTQVCRPCLDQTDGAWQLRWRLPWAFICPAHHQLLETHCPRCGRLLNEHHLCPRHIGRDQDWRHWPTTTPLWTDQDLGRQLASAQAIDQALAGQACTVHGTQPAHPADFLDAVRGIVGLYWHAQQGRQQRPRRLVAAPPRDAMARGNLIMQATELLSAPFDDSIDALTSLTAHIDRTAGLRAWLEDHSKPGPVLDPLIDAVAGCRASVGRRRANTCRQHLQPHKVPQLMHEADWEALRPMWDGSSVTGRCYACLTYLKVTQNCTWSEASALLELTPQIGNSVSRVGARDLHADASAFVQVVLNAFTGHPAAASTARPSVDFRARRAWVVATISAPRALRSLREHLHQPHLTRELLAERLWTQWALAHPALVPGRLQTSRLQRQRAATQRHRWTTGDRQRLTDWCERQDHAD